jgi:hypothetical protein
VQIADEPREISIGIDQQCAIPLFEQMARSASLFVNTARVLARESLNETAERDVGDLHDKMNRIRLPCEGVNRCPATRERAREKSFEGSVVSGMGKNMPAGVALQIDIINPS